MPLDFQPFHPYYFSAMEEVIKVSSIFTREFPKGRFTIRRDDSGAIVVERPLEPDRSRRLTTQKDQWLATGVMTKKEINRLACGGVIEVWGEELRAVVFEELWKDSEPRVPAFSTHRMLALL